MGTKPDPYTPEVAQYICEQLAAGKSLRAICRDDLMPDRSTVVQWVVDDRDGFANQYARSKAVGIDEFADETIEIADTEPERVGLTGAVDTGSVNHKRLMVDTRKWYVSKLAPKLYGDKLALEHSGEIGTRSFDDEERLAKIDAIFAAIERRTSGDTELDGIG